MLRAIFRRRRRPPKTYRAVDAYRRGRTFVVVSAADADLWYSRPPCFVLPESASDGELGAAVVAAIEAVWLSAPPPSDEARASWERDILDTVGVKDWETLERNARLASITLSDDEWRFSQYRRARGGGWVGSKQDDDLNIHLAADATPAEVGRALRDTLARPTMHWDG